MKPKRAPRSAEAPRIARAIVRSLAPAVDRAAILCDLDEGLQRHQSPRQYWKEVLASVPGLVVLRWRRAAIFADLPRDLRYALRLVRQHPGFTTAAVLTMAMGAGVTTAVASIVEAVLLRPLPYSNHDRVVVLQEWDTKGTGSGSRVSWSDYLELSARLQSFDAVAGFDGASRTLTGAGSAERLSAVLVTARFFDVLGVEPAAGRGFSAADFAPGADRVVVVSDGLWRRVLGGDPAAIGRTLVLNGAPSTVIGVLPARFMFPLRGAVDLWLPLRPVRAQVDRPYVHWLDLIALRRANVPAASAREELRAVASSWTARDSWHASSGLRAIAIRDDMVAGVRPALLVLAGGGLLLLLVAAANVSGLILSRAAGRAREFDVRAALGASRYRLLRLLGVESACLAAAGAASGLIVASWALAGFDATVPLRYRVRMPYADAIAVSPRVALLAIVFSCAAVVITSMSPAWRHGGSKRIDVGSGLRSTGGRSSTRLRSTLVAAQIALAVVLLAGAALVARSVWKLTSVSPGFEMDGLLTATVSLPGARYGDAAAAGAAVHRMLERIRAVPGVTAAEGIDQVALTGTGNNGAFTIAGRDSPGAAARQTLVRSVTAGYFGAMGIAVAEGRPFAPSDSSSSPRVVVVNRTFARRYFPGQSAVGQRLVFESVDGRPPWSIVGVAGDEQFNDLDKPMLPTVYFPFTRSASSTVVFVMRTPLPLSQVGEPLRAAVASIDADVPLTALRTMTTMAAESSAMFLRAIVMRMLAWFAIASLLLGGVGTYGVLSESLTARTREIGVRMALGATRGGISRMVLRAGAAPAIAGLAAGAALAAAAVPALRSLLFGVTLLDIPSVAAVLAMLACVTLAACAVPAWRAMRLPVTTALRTE
jgi:putative ABC transport system permease protein